MKIVFVIALIAALSGCANLAAKSAGIIGCPESEIKVSDGNMGWSTNTWTAQCRGETFICTYSSSMNLGSNTQCTKALPSK